MLKSSLLRLYELKSRVDYFLIMLKLVGKKKHVVYVLA